MSKLYDRKAGPARVKNPQLGELRPSQLLFTFGVGAVVDLPNISAMVLGLDGWARDGAIVISEERLLAAIRRQPGCHAVESLCLPPEGGVPVAPFPRWMRCPACSLLMPLQSGVFTLVADPWRPERSRYVHKNCANRDKPPAVHPARFLVACEGGHLDDFPWTAFVHKGVGTCEGPLRLREDGATGAARDILITCDGCSANRRMSDAFGEEGETALPTCRGRRPHLRDYQPDGCRDDHGNARRAKPILLGASNSWFPITASVLSLPTSVDPLTYLVEEAWPKLVLVEEEIEVRFLRKLGSLGDLATYSDDVILAAIAAKRAGATKAAEPEDDDLKVPEYLAFTNPAGAPETADFRLRSVAAPAGVEGVIRQVVLVERLREVRALLGFTRIDSPGDFSELEDIPAPKRAPLARTAPSWVPAAEVRGEGIFIEFDEGQIDAWCRRHPEWNGDFAKAHEKWRRARQIPDPEEGFPGLRYVFLHTFSHALMRQLALECGYTAASIRERIYATDPGSAAGPPMAGVLLYTAAPDSEGTLGGLVALGEPKALGRHLEQALAQMRLCTSDPLCAEHHPTRDGTTTLHGAACHACLFAPETSCERGNKYLDRSVIVPTLAVDDRAFFSADP